ncbi:MAG: orotate phosphoribosyltransferase [Dehalococcoidia bacterium]|nr:orotate phosphoribosyltransferase [Dehalococcoidia bacterium]MDH4367409.1 orotate phosphoribosyltransferase [Dehalococcoidia bacterium]
MSDEVLEIFKTAGAIKEGHFLLASGLHSPVYWEKFRILQYPDFTERLCRLIAQHFKRQKIDVVAGPTTGGIILAFETARQLGTRGIFAEKEGGARVFRRDFEIAPGQRVLIVDDILTTGSSLRETINAVDTLGGTVIGIGVLVDRSEKNLDFNAPLFSCLRAPTTVYSPQECPLCAAGIPLVKPGAPS